MASETATKTTLDVLIEARALIGVPSAWTTGVLCDDAGRKCALGAVLTVLHGEDAALNDEYNRLADSPVMDALNAALPEHFEGNNTDLIDRVISFNDLHDREDHHAKVLALFDKAIAAESA